LHILDDYVIAEIINPKTGGTLKLGELGELVLTSLKKEASPIIRYRTGDITKIIPGKCKCGRQSYRIDRIHGRINDTMFIRGIKVNPYELRDFILNIVGNNLKSSDIIFKIKKNDIKYTPQVYISVKDDKILPKLQKDIKDTTKVPFNINSVEPNFFGREDNNKVKLVQYVED
jgi:phenylacetate-CoA ligase